MRTRLKFLEGNTSKEPVIELNVETLNVKKPEIKTMKQKN